MKELPSADCRSHLDRGRLGKARAAAAPCIWRLGGRKRGVHRTQSSGRGADYVLPEQAAAVMRRQATTIAIRTTPEIINSSVKPLPPSGAILKTLSMKSMTSSPLLSNESRNSNHPNAAAPRRADEHAILFVKEQVRSHGVRQPRRKRHPT